MEGMNGSPQHETENNEETAEAAATTDLHLPGAAGLVGILVGCSSFLILGKAVDHSVFIYRMT